MIHSCTVVVKHKPTTEGSSVQYQVSPKRILVFINFHHIGSINISYERCRNIRSGLKLFVNYLKNAQ